jgi:hypothetical protein
MQSVLGRALPSFARSPLLKSISALLAALSISLIAAASSFAGATQSVVYCGDPLDIPNCDATGNYNWASQDAILEERTLTDPGEYVWTGQFRYGYGFIPGNDPIGGAANSGDPQIFANLYTDPAGEITGAASGLAFDPASNTIFIASDTDDKIVAFNRGSFDASGNSPGSYPVDYARGVQTGTISSPRGIDYNATTGDLIAVSGLWDLDTMSFTPGNRVDPPPAGGPALGTPNGIGSNGWGDEGTTPVDVVVDPTDGHTYVALATGLDDTTDEIAEYDENYDQVNSISVPQPAIWDNVVGLAIDHEARLLYVAKFKSIEVFSLSTGNSLGDLDFGYSPVADASLLAIDVDPIARALYVVTDEPTAADDSEAPVTGYSLDPPPSCAPQAVTMLPGASQAIIPSCTDVDGGTIEYSPVGAPTGGSVETLADRSALAYTAPNQVGSFTIAFRARSVNGRTTTINQPVTVAAPVGPPEVPVVRKTANLDPLSGVVLIRLPGTDQWIPLTEATLIPVGTVIDARKGKAKLTFANADGTLQDGTFWEGIFQVSQGSGNKPIVTLKLRDDLVGKANASIASMIATPAGFQAYTAKKRGKKKNGLWGDAKGKYKTSGKGGSATVRGTRWYVANYANGSLFKVSKGSVTIDPIRGKNFVLKAGKQFFIFYKKNS